MGKLNEAEASYTRAIALKPGLVEALNNRSVLRELGRLEDAESSCKKATVYAPLAEAHNNWELYLTNWVSCERLKRVT